jgi:carboxylesterase
MAAPLDRTASFRLESDGPRCLLIHGFTGSPAELSYVAARLAQAGFDVSAPCLPGHGRDADRESGIADWTAAGREALLAAADRGPVRIAGLSMGALVGLALAVERPDLVACLALLAPAVQLEQPGRAIAGMFRRFPALLRLVPRIAKRGGSDLRDPAARAWNPTGGFIPFHGLVQLAEFGARALELAPRVQCPTLMLLGELDATISNEAARRLAARLPGNTDVRVIPSSGHQIALDRGRGEVADLVIAHFRQPQNVTLERAGPR